MLMLQLKEEEENFEVALTSDRQFWELTEIKQRIKSLKNSLFRLEKWLQGFNK
jgi:hypothetical protein